MTAHSWHAKLIPATMVAAALLSGCIVVPARPYEGDEVVVNAAPPPPREEIIGVAPYPGYLWIGGYWGWIGGRHSWVGGHWEAPRAGYRWRPHAWLQIGGSWHLRPGHWDR